MNPNSFFNDENMGVVSLVAFWLAIGLVFAFSLGRDRSRDHHDK